MQHQTFPFPHNRLEVFQVSLEMASQAKRVADRVPRGHRSLADVLLQIFLALCVCRTSLASMEVMSGRLSAAVRRIFDLPDGQISDTTFGRSRRRRARGYP